MRGEQLEHEADKPRWTQSERERPSGRKAIDDQSEASRWGGRQSEGGKVERSAKLGGENDTPNLVAPAAPAQRHHPTIGKNSRKRLFRFS